MSIFHLRPRTTSIGSHLFVLTLGTLLPVVLFAGGLALVQAGQERQTFERGMHDRVVAITSAIDAELGSTVASLKTLAQSQALADGELERFHALAVRVSKVHRDWVTITLADPDGVQKVNASQPYAAAPLRVDERASFDAVLRTSKPVIGNLSLGPRGLRQAFPVRLPVLREGRLAYVLTAVVDPTAISRILSEQNMANDWVASVVDSRLIQVARLYDGQIQVGVTVAPAFRDALMSGPTKGAYRGSTLEGTPSYVTWRRSAFSGWSVGIGVPASTVEASAWRALFFGLLGLGVSLVLALLLSRLLARRISDPVAMLAAQARDLRRGDFSSSQPVERPDDASLLLTNEATGKTKVEPPVGHAPQGSSVSLIELRELQHALDDAAQTMKALGRARRNAERDNRAKDEFLAMLGHELRNPLSAITAAVQVLRMRPEGAPATMAQGVLKRQTAHLTKLIDDLLDASRVSHGKIELDRRPLDFADLVRRVATQVVGGSQLHLLDLRLEPAWVLGDDTRLEQIVTNLLSNAVRYSPDGGTIRVEVASADDRVLLRVSDEGVGIAAELLPRVFDLFVQGERGAARSQGGLGIGLTLASRLAELHDGMLTAQSEGEGLGSTFTLALSSIPPVLISDTATLAAASDAARRLRLLLVEDNDDGRKMLREVFEAAGHQVTEAVDGPQALEKARAGTFDVALIDLGLPGIDGLEVAGRLRREGPQPAILLVAITGYGAPQDRARSHEAGFDLHIVKPVDGVDLLEQVMRLLQAR